MSYRALSALVAVLAIAVLGLGAVSSASALESKPTTRRVVEGMCGGGIQTGGGHSGCTICTTKMCTDYDCTKKSCKLVNFIEGRPPSHVGIRTGVNQVGSKFGGGSKVSVDKGSGLKPVSTIGQVGVKSGGMNQNGMSHGGGMNQGGGHRH